MMIDTVTLNGIGKIGVVAVMDEVARTGEIAKTDGLHLQMNETTNSHSRRTTRMCPQALELTGASKFSMALLLHPLCLHGLYLTQTNKPYCQTLPLPTPLR